MPKSGSGSGSGSVSVPGSSAAPGSASVPGSLPPEEVQERREGERSEPSRSAGTSSGGTPSTQVRPRPTRRHFAADYKLRVLQEIDGCRAPGEIGAVLRREGLYSGHLSKWRIQRKQGALAALAARRRGPKPPLAEAREVEALRRENARLRRELEKANLCLEIQKKPPSSWGSP